MYIYSSKHRFNINTYVPNKYLNLFNPAILQKCILYFENSLFQNPLHTTSGIKANHFQFISNFISAKIR